MAKFPMIILAAPFALVGAAAPAAATAAAAEEDQQSIVVRYDDLNLSTASGREKLTGRVDRAVRQVCNSRPHYRATLSERATASKCEVTAMGDANAKLASLFGAAGPRMADQGGMTVVAR